MLKSLAFQNFKRFEQAELELRPLTILAGRNGAGKTSVIHGLLLAKQANRRNDGIAELNGPFGLDLGWFEDLINERVDAEGFTISVTDDSGAASIWEFSKGSTELYAKVENKNPSANVLTSECRSFQYLSAERSGPRLIQSALPLPLEQLEVGVNGEYAAQVLDKLDKFLIDEERLAPNPGDTYLLKAQTELWLSLLTRPVEIDTTAFSGTSVVSLSFRTPGASWVRPTNMGFGLSYSLPIILAALTAPRGGLLIVENPEAHLHPAGQSSMGTFLAQMAASGIQVLLETHSDHVVNGIRRAIGELKTLESSQAIVHFFDDNFGPILPLKFDDIGGISQWPRGFFDQYQIDIANITRIRRPK